MRNLDDEIRDAREARMRERLAGRVSSAQVYERICEDIYGRLPEFARW